MECRSICAACPFSMSEEAEQAQNYGCLPDRPEIMKMMDEQEATWSCHEEDGRLCAGYAAAAKKAGINFRQRPLFRTETYLRTGKRLLLTQVPEPPQ